MKVNKLLISIAITFIFSIDARGSATCTSPITPAYDLQDTVLLIVFSSNNGENFIDTTFLDKGLFMQYNRNSYRGLLSINSLDINWNCSIARWELISPGFNQVVAYNESNTEPFPPCHTLGTWIINDLSGGFGPRTDSIQLYGDCSTSISLDPLDDEDVCGDADSDAVKDFFDNCPQGYNPDQEDADQDGQGDVCDYLGDKAVGINIASSLTDFHISDSQVYIDNPYKGILMMGQDSLCYRLVIDVNGSLKNQEVDCPK